jgi:proteasome accessory factor A
MGLETEYAVSIPEDPDPEEPDRWPHRIESHRDAFDAIVDSLRERLPCADADVLHSGKSGIFLATGGAVWFESLLPSLNVGLVEGATPEALGPRHALACQRGQDRLFYQAAAENGVRLLKNDCDARDRVYGAQENYEIEVFQQDHRDNALAKLVLFLIATVAFFSQLIAGLLLLSLLITLPITALIYRGLASVGFYQSDRHRRAGFDYWIGRVYRTGWNGADFPLGGWSSRVALAIILLAVLPLSLLVWLVVLPTGLGRMHRRLAPFLATRLIFAGAGRIDRRGRFHLSDKAFSRRMVAGIPEYAHGFFSIGQVIKPLLNVTRTNEVLKLRQRVQVAIGDSNRCEEAEYLRIATTALVIDAIESGYFDEPIRIRRPVSALLRFDRDPTLTTTCHVVGKGKRTAVEVQRMYWERCRRYVDDAADQTWIDDPRGIEEANQILLRWKQVLDALEQDPESLIGRVDWVTKKFLLEQAAPRGRSASVDAQARKKIDLRYHELGPEGYFDRFAQSDLYVRVLSEEEIDRASRLPPPGSPAAKRAIRIREFSRSGGKVSW